MYTLKLHYLLNRGFRSRYALPSTEALASRLACKLRPVNNIIIRGATAADGGFVVNSTNEANNLDENRKLIYHAPAENVTTTLQELQLC